MRLTGSARSVRGVALLSILVSQVTLAGETASDLVGQIAAIMSQGPSGKAHQRFIHAKGIVCTGTFEVSEGAAAISRATHFGGGQVPVTVRFSDGAPDIAVPDNSSDASPRGVAIRFGNGRGTDIMAISHNGFIVGTGEEFLALEKAIAASDSSKPHPLPIETFMASHPRASKFVQELNRVPGSFATESYYSNNALIFVNSKQERHAGRYQIVPMDGPRYLDEAAAKAMAPDFLSEELRGRLAKTPARFRLLLQIAEPGDKSNDGSLVWPDSRRKVELGIITIASVVPDSAAAERALAFDPTRLVDGIELSDDPLPALRSHVYAYSVAARRAK
jgi:catalase